MKTVQIGVFGLRRGLAYFDSILGNNAEIVAICDKDEERIRIAKEKVGDSAAAYTDFDEFINHPMDAVLLCNYFHEHAPFAVKCLEKNIHVLSECTSNATMAEGVALVRAAEKSKAFYMLCENYPFMEFNLEMKRVYESGNLGKVLFGEGEYNHPSDVYTENSAKDLFDSMKHWRIYNPKTYYITHSLAPLMHATGSKPVRVTSMPVFDPLPGDCNNASRVGERAAIVTCLNDDNSVFRVTGHATFGGHDNSYRICGQKGMIENVRGSGGKISLSYNEWELPEGAEARNFYKPELNDPDEELIRKAGHGGGDFRVMREFLNCVREGRRPVMDEYFATRLASVAIMAHKSLLEFGMPYDIPDLSKEEERVKYENDYDSPYWYSNGRAPTMPCCSRPDFKPSDTQIENFKKRLEK